MKKWLCCLLLTGLLIAAPKAVFAAEFGEADISEPFITIANLNLRVAPTTESDKLLTVPRGTIVWVTDYLDYEWYMVAYEGNAGYMKAEYLEASQEAPATDDAVQGTPEAAYAETAVGTVELLDWSEAKKVFTLGTPAQVIDVRTRITYQVSSFSNGKHADVEPISPEDTANMKRTYGGSWSWDTRPVLVIINGRTLAASINGMPHGGGVNDNNNMNGQVCIHFKGSKTHNGNKSHENDHQNAVMEAFNTAKSW